VISPLEQLRAPTAILLVLQTANDYYRFSLGTSSNFSLNLTGLSADADVSLLDSNGSEITSSTNGSNSSESITGQLNAGTYYIRVLSLEWQALTMT
jgi:hypothetical protein